jgi:site-specific recombinase XerC
VSVQEKMGHKSITSTEIYEHCDAGGQVEQYTIKAVSSKEEAVKLGELGFEPFDEIDGVKLYRRRLIDW